MSIPTTRKDDFDYYEANHDWAGNRELTDTHEIIQFHKNATVRIWYNEQPQYNIDVSMLEAALSEKTKAVMLAHTLGNPFDLKSVKEFCTRHGLWLVEDNCDALGTKYTLDGNEQIGRAHV